MMMSPTITGFYFDPVKKKYFKVLPTHLAPKGVKYSEEAIKTEKARDSVSPSANMDTYGMLISGLIEESHTKRHHAGKTKISRIKIPDFAPPYGRSADYAARSGRYDTKPDRGRNL